MGLSIADIRTEYKKNELNEDSVTAKPMDQFDIWFKEALAAEVMEVNAMTLATSSSDGLPSARIVLLKGYSEEGLVFFTNYLSFKGLQLQENPRASIVFFWKELERQVRITGISEKISASLSDEYFLSRPLGSRIGAIASPQSHVISSRRILEKRVEELSSIKESEIKRPAHWGGYLIKPITAEFWQGRPNRLHDRILYSLEDNGKWKRERLAP